MGEFVRGEHRDCAGCREPECADGADNGLSLERESFDCGESVGGEELRYAVVITASFNVRENGVDGRIVIVLGVSSLERLIQAVERWEESQY